MDLKASNSSAHSLVSRQSNDSASSSRLRTSDAATASLNTRKDSKLSKFLPGSRRSRRRRSDTADTADTASTADAEVERKLALSLVDSNVSNSQLTSGSEPDEDEENPPAQLPTRPTLSPHQSHVGFLTLSSPLIPAETIDSRPIPPPSSSQAATIPRSTDTLTPPPSAARRTPSPVGRLKDALGSARRSSTTAKTALTDGTITRAGAATGAGGGGSSSGAVEPIFSARGRTESNTSTPASSRTTIHPLGRPAANVFGSQPTSQEPGETIPSPKPVPKSILTSLPPSTPPNPIDGPTTLVTPPTPTEGRSSSEQTHRRGLSASSLDQKASVLGHKRIRSANNPSRLSQAVSVPLTPAEEEVKTPGGTLTTPQSGGFFSSVFSAAQNAANSVSNTITFGATNQKNKPTPGPAETSGTGQAGGEEVILPINSRDTVDQEQATKRKPAVETLGSGNLSLSHLGISESEDISPMSSRVNLSETMNGSSTPNVAADEVSAKKDDMAANRAVSEAYTVKESKEKTSPAEIKPQIISDDHASIRPSIEPETGSIRRAGSVRSKLSGGRRRRTRGSSANTTSGLATPGVAQRLTGFTVANAKRNRDFHNTFKSVPEDDCLIEDYACALQRDILLQGRLYISEGHICFWSNIFGYITTLVMSFDEVISVEKKSTAVIFQNGIVIQTLHARNSFASLLNRESTYELIISIWRISHPNLKSSLNGNPLVEGGGTGDKTEKAASIVEDDSASEEIYDEDEEDDDDEDAEDSFVEAQEGSVAGSEAGDARTNRKVSAAVASGLGGGSTAKTLEAAEAAVSGSAVGTDFPGPSSHDPTDCGDSATHGDKPLTDTTIPAPLGKIHSLLFGPLSGAFMRKFLTEDQKSQDLQFEDDKRGLDKDKKTRSYTYIKQLGGSIGPKQTKCITNETLEQLDMEKAVTVLCSTQTPDVPSGNIFLVKTKYCLMWGPGNSTRLIMTCSIEWSGKSWLKGPIEKGANDGQIQYAKDLVAALRAAVTRASVSKNGPKGKGKGRKKRDTDATDTIAEARKAGQANAAASREANWGLLEPFRAPLEPIVSILGSLLSTNVSIALLCVVIVTVVWWQSRMSPSRVATSLGAPVHQRLALYEDMWRSEETELWKWLEERVGMDVMTLRADPGAHEATDKHRQKVVKAAKSLDDIDQLGEIDMDEAVRVTKERLLVLEDALRSRRTKRESEPAESVG